MSAVSALRARVRLARPLSSATARRFAERSLFSASAPSGPAGRAPQTRPPAFRATATLTRRAFRVGARETRGVTCAAGDRADGEASSRASTRTSDEPTATEMPVSFSLDEEDEAEASAGEGSSGHDVVRDARDARGDTEASETDEQPPVTGWDTKPTSIMPSAYFQGEVGYSKFYPPEARDYEYARKLMVAVDGSAESERAVEWAIRHLCRSGDLLQIVHCCIAGAIDPRLASYYNGPSIMSGDQIRADPNALSAPLGTVPKKNRPEYPERFPKRPMYDDSWAPTRLKEVRVRRAFVKTTNVDLSQKRTAIRLPFPIERLTRRRTPSRASALGALFDPRRRKPHVPVDIFADPKLQDAYYSAAVLRTEAMLDDVYRKLKATHGAHPIRSFREKRSIYLRERRSWR